jgi:hypothetical protein
MMQVQQVDLLPAYTLFNGAALPEGARLSAAGGAAAWRARHEPAQ